MTDMDWSSAGILSLGIVPSSAIDAAKNMMPPRNGAQRARRNEVFRRTVNMMVPISAPKPIRAIMPPMIIEGMAGVTMTPSGPGCGNIKPEPMAMMPSENSRPNSSAAQRAFMYGL